MYTCYSQNGFQDCHAAPSMSPTKPYDRTAGVQTVKCPISDNELCGLQSQSVKLCKATTERICDVASVLGTRSHHRFFLCTGEAGSGCCQLEDCTTWERGEHSLGWEGNKFSGLSQHGTGPNQMKHKQLRCTTHTLMKHTCANTKRCKRAKDRTHRLIMREPLSIRELY